MSTASNFRTIRGSDDNFGVGAFLSGYLAPGLGSLTNGSATDTTALIVGHVGATVETDDTLTNFWTVSGTGGFAVSLATATSRLNAEAGSVFEGKILIEGGLADFVGGVSTVSGLETVLGGTIKGAGTVSLDGDVSEFGPGTRLTVAGVIVSGAATQVNVYTDLTYAKLWAQTAGTLAVGAGHRMTFTGANDIFSGTLTGAGTVAFTRGSDTLDNLTLSAASLVIDTARVTLQGVIVLTTSLIATTANLIVAASGATLSGGGRLTLSDNATNRLLGASVTATLTNVNDTIAGVGRLGGGTMILVNQAGGVIDGDATLGLVIDTGANTIANAGTIEATGAGGLTIAGAVANTGVLAATVGTLTVNGAVTGAGKVLIDGGTADFTSTFNQKVRFVTGAAGVLELARSRIYTGAIVGFSRTGDTSLDLADIAFGGSTRVSYSGTTTSGVLTVTDGTHSAHIKLRGDYTASTFNVSSDGHGGTTLVDPTRSPPHVFIAAMAGMGASGAGGAIGARPDVERSGLAMLARPGFAPA